MKSLTRLQAKEARMLREQGFSAKEARRIARLSYAKLSDELGRKLREQTNG
jgi:hypothetical protein